MKVFRNPSPEVVHPPIAGYHHQVEITPPHRWLVLSGQLGIHPDGRLSDDPIEQLSVALENVRHNLFAGDMRIKDVVKLTIYLVGEIDTERRRWVIADWLAGHKPAMTVVYVAGLADPRFRVEVDATAAY